MMGFISSALESTLDFLLSQKTCMIELIEELLVTRKDSSGYLELEWSRTVTVGAKWNSWTNCHCC